MNDQLASFENRANARIETSVQRPGLGNEPPTDQDPGEAPGLVRTVELSPLAELDQLVTAERLRIIVWDRESRPSMQWIRKETKRRMLPHIRRGRLIFYRPRVVLEWYAQRESRPASMK
jgi:hypothetical protein